MWDQIFYFFKFGQFWWKCHLAYKLKGQGHHVVCGSLCSKLWCWVWRPSAKCTCTHTQTHFICTHCTPKVTPQDKSFTNPLTGRWGNQLTSQPGSVSCSLGVLNGTLSDGHRTAKEEAPLTEEGRCDSCGNHWAKKEQGQTAMANMRHSVCTV